MQEVQITRDYLDYLQAFGGIGSLLIALVAAWFAWRSARSSEESADAAERTAEAAEITADAAKRETELLLAEHERAPNVQASLYIEETRATPDGKFEAFVKFEAYNTGARIAEGAFCAFFVPDSVAMTDCSPNGAPLKKQSAPMPQSTVKLEVDGEPQRTHSLNATRNLIPHVADVRHICLTFQQPGLYQLLAGVRHPDISDGESRVIEEIRVPHIEAGPPTLPASTSSS